jgi:ADP-heptose:LPS heptosyltransferase
MKRIVIIHAGGIGDLVQALPALAGVRAAWPGAAVTLIGRPERAVLARMAGVADACMDVETCGLWRLAGGDAAGAPALAVLGGADLVLDFLTKGALAAGLNRPHGPQVVWVEPLPPPRWTETAAAWVSGQVRERLGTRPPAPAPEIAAPEAALAAARGILAARRGGHGPFVAIHPGSGSAKKNWPADRFAQVAERVRHEWRRDVVWLAGPAEIERGTLPPQVNPEAILEDLPLDEVAAVLALADAYLGNDSGITQVAAAVRRPDGRATPTVALFGPTDARVWAPRGDHVRVVRSPDGPVESIAAEEVWAALVATA